MARMRIGAPWAVTGLTDWKGPAMWMRKGSAVAPPTWLFLGLGHVATAIAHFVSFEVRTVDAF